MNTSPVVLITPGAVATIRPLTATTGEVLEVVGDRLSYHKGDVVTLPAWFINRFNMRPNEFDYWLCAALPDATTTAGKTVVTPENLENLHFWK